MRQFFIPLLVDELRTSLALRLNTRAGRHIIGWQTEIVQTRVDKSGQGIKFSFLFESRARETELD